MDEEEEEEERDELVELGEDASGKEASSSSSSSVRPRLRPRPRAPAASASSSSSSSSRSRGHKAKGPPRRFYPVTKEPTHYTQVQYSSIPPTPHGTFKNLHERDKLRNKIVTLVRYRSITWFFGSRVSSRSASFEKVPSGPSLPKTWQDQLRKRKTRHSSNPPVENHVGWIMGSAAASSSQHSTRWATHTHTHQKKKISWCQVEW